MTQNCWHECWGLMAHLLFTLFLHFTAVSMVIPALTDVTMSALCPGVEQCSQAIYLSGLQQTISGIGTMLVTPVMGDLSDHYGRKALLMIPVTVSVVPLGVFAYSRTKAYVYAHYVLQTAALITSGSLHCLSLAYVADNIPQDSRTAAFGVLMGVISSAFVLGLAIARFLPERLIFQVATVVAVFAAAYLKAFLVEPKFTSSCLPGSQPVCLVKSTNFWSGSRSICSRSCVQDIVQLFKRSLILAQITVVAFFSSLADAGVQGSLLFYLKARFHFEKDQYADLLLIAGVAGVVSQLLIMPLLARHLGEHKLLCIGLFAGFAHTLLYGIAWSSWVPYVAALTGVFFPFVFPCVGSIVSKEAGADEQGKVQGCISSIRSFGTIIAPLTMSPLTALFLSNEAPFNCPGFSLICAAFVMVIAFIQASVMKPKVTDHVQVLSLEDEQAIVNAPLISSSD